MKFRYKILAPFPKIKDLAYIHTRLVINYAQQLMNGKSSCDAVNMKVSTFKIGTE